MLGNFDVVVGLQTIGALEGCTLEEGNIVGAVVMVGKLLSLVGFQTVGTLEVGCGDGTFGVSQVLPP